MTKYIVAAEAAAAAESNPVFAQRVARIRGATIDDFEMPELTDESDISDNDTSCGDFDTDYGWYSAPLGRAPETGDDNTFLATVKYCGHFYLKGMSTRNLQ